MSSGSQYPTNGEAQLANDISGTKGYDGFGSVPNIPEALAGNGMLHIAAAAPMHQYAYVQQQIDTQGRVVLQPGMFPLSGGAQLVSAGAARPQIILQPQFFEARNPQLPTNHPPLQAMQFPGNQQYVVCSQPQGFMMPAGQPSPPIHNRPQYIVLPNGSYGGGQAFFPGYPQPSAALALQSTSTQPIFPSIGVPVAHPGTLVAAPQPTFAASTLSYGATTVPEDITATALTTNQDSTGLIQPSWDGTTLSPLQPGPVAGADLEQVRRIAKSNMPHRPLHGYNYFFIDERERILKQDARESPPANSNGTTSDVEVGVCNDDKEEEMMRKKRILDRQLQRDRTKRRPHRKTHGKISFRGLSSRISQTWRKMSDDKKQFYRDIATLDAERYRKELEVMDKKAQGDASPN